MNNDCCGPACATCDKEISGATITSRVARVVGAFAARRLHQSPVEIAVCAS